MPNTVSGPYAKTAWVDGTTALNQTRMNNGETQSTVALASLNPDVVGSGFILSGCAATRHNSYSATVLADTPLRYHRLGESSGAGAFDLSGNGQVGTYNASPTLGAASLLTGDSDTAVTFTAASSQYVSNISTTGLPTGAGNISIECWFKFAANPGANQFVLDIGDRGTVTHHLVLVLLTTGAVQLSNGTTGINSAALTTGTRHHLVGTYDGTNLRLYVDGALAAGPTAATNALAYTGNAYCIASQSGATPGAYFNGTVDEVAIYSSVLSSTRVTAHYTNGTTATTTVDIASGSAYLVESDGTLARCTVVSTTQTTSSTSTTYHLYLQPDGTWYWSTSNSPASNSLAVANVATDGSGNAVAVTDLRSYAISLFPAATSAAFNFPQVVAQANDVANSVTTDQLILAYTPVATGWYRINLVFEYHNGTPQKPNVNVHWLADTATSYAINNFRDCWDGQFLNGSQTSAAGSNQEHACEPITIRVLAGQPFGVHFIDGGGTPASIISVLVERLT